MFVAISHACATLFQKPFLCYAGAGLGGMWMERTSTGRGSRNWALLFACIGLVGALSVERAWANEPVRLSVPAGGGSLDHDILFARPDARGTRVLLLTAASNLSEGDHNDKSDLYLVDREASSVERVSVSFLGRDANDGSFPGVLSDDGAFVVFGSAATNLVTGDFNRTPDLFLFDRGARRTRALTLANDGLGGGTVPDLPPAISADARWVAFASLAHDFVQNDRNEASDIFLLDRDSGVIEAVTVTALGAPETRTANGPSFGPALSADGCIVSFFSDATNLVPADRNQARDVFVSDRCRGNIERVSVASDGSEANGPSQVELAALALSGDGRFVAFASRATNLDGDTRRQSQVFLRDRALATTRLVSRAQNGDIADAPSVHPSLDRDGRFLVFQSSASNLVANDPWPGEDVFVIDLSDGEVHLVSQPATHGVADGDSFAPSLSADGSHIVFLSAARLSPEDSDNRVDAYIVQNPLYGTPPANATPTPTAEQSSPTATWTEALTLTPTSSPTQTISPSPTASFTATVFVPTATNTPTLSLTPLRTATASPTEQVTLPTGTPTRSSGGDNGGCSCRVDADSGALRNEPLSWQAFLPLVWAWWRRRVTKQ